MFGKDLDKKNCSNNELVHCLDYLLKTHEYSGRAAMSKSFHAFFYDMIGTHDVYVSQIDGNHFVGLPPLKYNQSMKLVEDFVLESSKQENNFSIINFVCPYGFEADNLEDSFNGTSWVFS